ncbi:MAG: glycosyltransferase family 4 protein, partial [Patescibacteria group bacterium]
MLSNPRADGFNVMTHQKPRVLIFSLAYFPLVGGAEIAVKEITDRLGDLFDFDLITLRFSGNHEIKEAVGNVSVYRIGGAKWVYPFKTALLARKLHRQNNYQIVWSVMAAYAGFGALFFKLVYPRVPMLLTLQEGDSEQHILKRVGVFYPLWRLIFKKADHIQVISSYLADFARRHGATCHIEIV